MDDRAFKTLIEYLKKTPSVTGEIGFGSDGNGFWWIKFHIDTSNSLAWNVVQELAHVLNYLSVNERLPTTFYPVSPPPYMNGGPEDFLSWIIENKDEECRPGTIQKWLEERLPQPIDDLKEWPTD